MLRNLRTFILVGSIAIAPLAAAQVHTSQTSSDKPGCVVAKSQFLALQTGMSYRQAAGRARLPRRGAFAVGDAWRCHRHVYAEGLAGVRGEHERDVPK
jgi:hypothetical protein